MQGTECGRSIESAGKDAMYDRSLTLKRLLHSPELFRESGLRRHACYLLAGSFTGFLIRHYGWESYRRFYCLANEHAFRATFRKCFDMSLQTAEYRWRHEAVAQDS
jgi:hypothetical protein